MDAIRKKIIADITSADLKKSSYNINNPSKKEVENALDGLIEEDHSYAYIDSHSQILIDRLLRNNPSLSLAKSSYSPVDKRDIKPKKKSFLSMLINWLIGILLIVGSLGFMTHSVLPGIGILVAGLLFLPPIHNLIYSKIKINLHWIIKITLAVACMFYASNVSLEKDKKNFEANKENIFAEIKQKISDKDFLGATALASKYNSITEDNELKKLHDEARAELKKVTQKEEAEVREQDRIAMEKSEKLNKEKEAEAQLLQKTEAEEVEIKRIEDERIALKEREGDLLKELETVDKNDLYDVHSLYEKLLKGSPDNEEYIAKTKEYKLKYDQQRTKDLVARVKKVKASNFKENLEIYKTLVELNPDNSKFIDKEKHYKQKNDEEENKARIRKLLMGEKPVKSAWDGTYYVVENYLERVANDPDSIDVESCTDVYTTDDGWLVGCNYRGKNAFGGMIRKANWFTILQGNVVKMHPYSAYSP